MKIQALEQFNSRMPAEVWKWRDSLIGRHLPLVGDLVANYSRDARTDGYQRANLNLLELDDRLTVPVYTPLALGLGSNATATMDNDELCDLAKQAARWCDRAVEELDGDLVLAAGMCEEHCGDHGVKWPLAISKNDSPEKIREKICGALARVSCERWWRRQLRVKYGRQVEQVLRSVGRVQKRKQPYVSDWAFKRWVHAQKRNRELLESMEAENQDGQVYTLAELADKSVSNPDNREDEFFVRSRGFEEIADEMKLPRLFLTLTAPGKYHARHHYGPQNAKYNGATPDAVQAYLTEVWARIRARWARVGIKTFGFRVVEPHHDGTPHWHMMLYFSEADIAQAWQIFRDVATAEDPHELRDPSKGRADWYAPRVDVKRLEVGESATGYLAKYLSKNITGGAVDLDWEAQTTGSEGALRARAWASMWGIRQFQQIGSVSVTVWRELRRVSEIDQGLAFAGDVEKLEAIRAACDAGDWRTFVELMGGPLSARSEQPLRAHMVKADKVSAYGDVIERIRGVIMRGASEYIKTRIHEWTVRRVAVRPEPVQPVARGPAQPGHSDLCQ